MFEKFTLEQFVTDAASAKPTPGGGSVAALTASCGAALMAMLCNLTAGKKGFESFFDEMSRLAEKYSAVYFAAIGGAGALYGNSIKKSECIAFDDLLSEAVHRLEVENFPAVVAMDCHGGNIYRQ